MNFKFVWQFLVLYFGLCTHKSSNELESKWAVLIRRVPLISVRCQWEAPVRGAERRVSINGITLDKGTTAASPYGRLLCTISSALSAREREREKERESERVRIGSIRLARLAIQLIANRFVNTHILSINRAVFWLYSSLEIRKSLSRKKISKTTKPFASVRLRRESIKFCTVNRCEIKDLDFHFQILFTESRSAFEANLSVVLFFFFLLISCSFLVHFLLV